MTNPIGRILPMWGKLGGDKSGNVAPIFALALIPVLGMVGAGVDYSRAANVRAHLQAAADAAAVGAIAKPSTGYKAALTMVNDGPIPSGATQALNIFNGNVSLESGFTVTNLAATVVRATQQVTATVTFTATVPANFIQVFGGGTTMTVSGTSSATNNMPTYIDFYLLLDNTPSMGVGATPADVATMVANTPDQCAFACHDTNNSNSYYNLAKNLGVTMRIDVVRTATQQLMTTATSTASVSGQFRMAIYTFGTSASTAGLTKVSNLTTNLTQSAQDAGTIDLMTVQGQNQNNDMDTDYDAVFTALNSGTNKIPNPGTGQSASSPQKVLFFVSDGVADEANSSCQKPTTNGTRCQEPINTALCQAIKDRGVMIAVLYTTYLPLPTNAWYNPWISPFQSSIATNMETCASPNLYFEVTPTQGIASAMNALFQRAIEQARLTN